MKALLILLFSFGAFSQEFLKCQFEIRDNETEIEALEESKVSFLIRLHETEHVKREIPLYKVRVKSKENKEADEREMHEHQILAFEMDAKGTFSETLKAQNRVFDIIDTGDRLKIDVSRVYDNMSIDIRTDWNHWNFVMGGPYTREITNEFNALTPLYTRVHFEKVKKKLFGKDQLIIEREMIPIYYSCQKLDTSFVIQTDLSNKENMLYSPLDESGSATAFKN